MIGCISPVLCRHVGKGHKEDGRTVVDNHHEKVLQNRLSVTGVYLRRQTLRFVSNRIIATDAVRKQVTRAIQRVIDAYVRTLKVEGELKQVKGVQGSEVSVLRYVGIVCKVVLVFKL